MGALIRIVLFAASMVGIGGAVAGDKTTTNYNSSGGSQTIEDAKSWEWYHYALLIVGILSGVALIYLIIKKLS